MRAEARVILGAHQFKTMPWPREPGVTDPRRKLRPERISVPVAHVRSLEATALRRLAAEERRFRIPSALPSPAITPSG